MEFKDIVKNRYATKKFSGESLPQEKVDELLEMIRLSASSYGIQPTKIIVISDPALKEKLSPVSYDQAQIKSCSHLLVFCANTDITTHIDMLEKLMAGLPEETVKMMIGGMRDFDKRTTGDARVCWCQRQTYLAIGNAINGAKSLGFDSCPMEGFNPEEYSKILELPENIIPSALVTIGIAADEQNPKIRLSKEELFDFR